MKKLLIFAMLLLIAGNVLCGVFSWLLPSYLKTNPLPIDIATFRLQFPLYNDVEGDTLATTLHDNFFSHISQERFHRHFIPPELDKPEYMQTKPIVLPPQKGHINRAFVDYLVAGGSAKGDFWIWDLSRKGGRSLLTAPPPPWIKDAGIVSLAGAGVGALFFLSYVLIGIWGWFAKLRLWRFLWSKRQGLVLLVGATIFLLLGLYPPESRGRGGGDPSYSIKGILGDNRFGNWSCVLSS